jgi:hypothetical protein
MSQELASPLNTLDKTDPGDELQRNIRYQNACGLIILIESLTGKYPYSSIWCEHHDDILGERQDGLFDFYQIKTRKPENGAWKLTDEQVINSFKKFVSHFKKFKNKIGKFYFASNADYFSSNSKQKIGQSPVKLLEAIALEEADGTKIREELEKALRVLSGHCECKIEELKDVFLKTEFILAPERNSYETIIASDFLPQLSWCSRLSRAELNALRDELIQVIFKASSLSVDDPSKYWYCVHGDASNNPFLYSKRVTTESIKITIQERQSVPLRFNEVVKNYNLSITPKSNSVLEKKFIYAGLNDHLETMQNRMLAAERRLLDLATRNPERDFEERINQYIAVVKGECDESALESQVSDPAYRESMLRIVYRRLRELADTKPSMVYNEQYEFLVGFAALLTSECAVWWSEKFDLELVP